MICATGLVTKGMICCQIAQSQLVSCDKPRVTGVVEVRPKMRRAAAPEPTGDPVPQMRTNQELRPSMKGKASAVPSATVTPKSRVVQELRPKIVKAKEEE